MRYLLALVIVSLAYVSLASAQDDKVQVHLVCHTHDDVGWLKTVDEYFYGANNSIQHAGVQYILDSVLVSLQQNPDRKFIYVEQAFFTRWWDEQSAATQEIVKKLVANGQLTFINGGWCMHDEATTHYLAMIDQMTEGHRFLKETFGVTPNIGWQIDPFGHSSEHATMIAEMGFDGLFFARVDYQDKLKRMAEKTPEMIWRGSPSYGTDGEIFTGVLFSGYGPPNGFCWDQSCSDPPIQDDKRLFNYNVEERVNDFVSAALQQAASYQTKHIMMTMGSDFQYENANLWYKNLDKLIKYVNEDGRVNVFYSTPYDYVKAKNAANITWTVKTDDFFPYADDPHSYWTGYFTSRPALKGYVRDMSGYMQAARQLESLSRVAFPTPGVPSTSRLAQAMGVAQHHDAVSGTEKQAVAYDYAERISIGHSLTEPYVNSVIQKETGSTAPWTQCPLLNVSSCPGSETGKEFSVALYNPLAWETRTEYARIPVTTSNVTVKDSTGAPVTAQVIPLSSSQLRARDDPKSTATYEVVFAAQLPPLGLAVYTIAPSSSDDPHAAVLTRPRKLALNGATTIANKNVQVVFGPDGKLNNITNLVSGVTAVVNQDWYWYNASTGNDVSSQASGAYIFRPNGTEPFQIGGGASFSVINGPVVNAVWQEFAPWVTQQVRIYEGSSAVENEFTVGPIPIEDGLGKEIITRFSTDSTSDVFFTDSNGRMMIKRQINYRPTWNLTVTEPVSDNYFPVNTGFKLPGIAGGNGVLTVITDRSQGAGLVRPGQPELMVHRRLLKDDSRGVGEPLNEPGLNGKGLIIRAKHWLLVDDTKSAAISHRTQAELSTYPARYFFADQGAPPQGTKSYVKTALPRNLELLSFNYLNETTRLLRIAHLYPVNEDPTMSVPVTFDIASLFSDLAITAMVEMNLSANQPKSAVNRLKWQTDSSAADPAKPSPADGLSYTFQPGRIYTFEVTVSAGESSSPRAPRRPRSVKSRIVRK